MEDNDFHFWISVLAVIFVISIILRVLLNQNIIDCQNWSQGIAANTVLTWKDIAFHGCLDVPFNYNHTIYYQNSITGQAIPVIIKQVSS